MNNGGKSLLTHGYIYIYMYISNGELGDRNQHENGIRMGMKRGEECET